jgi:NAD(P)H-dependent flavin oxidoreductase YrpB (nitropropane dioxygenase family)
MIKFIKKIFAKWFSKKEAIKLTKKATEPVVEKPTHCGGHTRFKKSCSLCNAIIA